MVRLLDQFSKAGDIGLFGDSELAKSEEHLAAERDVRQLWKKLVDTYGEGIEPLLDEYTEALGIKEEFVYEYYFEQGFMVARR